MQRRFQVLAATGIRATDLSGHSDPYCVCYLKVPDSPDIDAGGNIRGRRGVTYFVEKTLHPKWSGQRFVFKVLHEEYYCRYFDWLID